MVSSLKTSFNCMHNGAIKKNSYKIVIFANLRYTYICEYFYTLAKQKITHIRCTLNYHLAIL